MASPAGFVPAGVLWFAATPAAQAHVKWFVPTNVHEAPVPLIHVLSASFLAALAAFCVMVLSGFILDGWVARRWPRFVRSGLAFAGIEERLIRAATGAYFIGTSDTGGIVLTPELVAHSDWMRGLQFAIALALLWRPTCLLSAAGILSLYGDAIRHFGMFHLTDYVFIPCLALYLASVALPSRRLATAREPLLVGGLAFSLAWTAIEKFLYPQWTEAVIALHPSVGLGMDPSRVTIIAGFVEFTLAFYLVSGRGLLRLGGLGYAAIFIAAMPAFGRLDVFGHLIILSILAIVMLRGATPMQDRLHRAGRPLLQDAAWVLSLYIVTMTGFFVAYYAMQRL